MRCAIASMLLLLFILPSPLFASEAEYEKGIARGIAGIENNELREAADELRAALRERPNDLQATLLLGIALNRARDPEAEALLKKVLAREPDNPRANLELGVVYLNRGVVDEARDYFENTRKVAPGSVPAARAGEFLALLKERKVAKTWDLRFLTGMQYDSNVVLNAEGAPLPAGTERRGDWRWILAPSAYWTPLSGDRGELKATYSFYRSFHFRLDPFDTTQNLLELGGRLALSPLVSLRLGYAFEHLMIGDDGYAVNHSVTPGLTLTLANGATTAIDYRFRDTSYKNSSLFPTNTDRSGENHQVGIMQKIPLAGAAVLRLGFWHEEELTKAGFWDFSGNRVLAGIGARLPLELTADLSGEVNRRDYGVFPAVGVARADTSWIGTLALSRALGAQLSLIAGFYYNRNESNIPSFDYVRTITSILAQARF